MNLAALGLISLIVLGLYAAFQLQPNRYHGRPEIVNAYGIVLIALALNIVLPAALSHIAKDGVLVWARPFSNSPHVIEALLITLVALASFCLGFGVYRAVPSLAGPTPKRVLPVKRLIPETVSRDAVNLLWSLVVVGVMLKLAALVQIGIGPDLIARMSGSIRSEMIQTGNEGVATTYLVLISTMAEAAAAMLFAISIKNRRRILLAITLTLACLTLTFILSGKRSTMILPLALVICAFTTIRHPITVRSLPLVFVVLLGFGMGTLLLRILAPQSAIGNVLDYRLLGGGSLVDFYLYSPEFAGFDMLVRAVGQADQIIDMFGGRAVAFYRAFFEPFLYIIPRAIWMDKPDQFVDLAHGFYAVTFSGGLTGQVGFNATLIGYSHVLGGPFAVAASFFALGLVAGWIDRPRIPDYSGLVFKAIGIVFIFTLFRQGSFGWTFLIFVQTMAPALLTWMIFLTLNSVGRYSSPKPARVQ
jgi:hypothetical protein